MTILLDLRAIPTGGFVAHEVAIVDGNSGKRLSNEEFKGEIAGKSVVLVTHGFNVNSRRGLDSLSKWDALCELPAPRLFVGVLWPGDSRFLPILDYPIEGAVAIQSGQLLAGFIDTRMQAAASLSMVSHSLGARTVLEAIQRSQRRFSMLILMAAAIEDDCLGREYAQAASRVDRIRVVASKADWVLAVAFPIGNPIGEIVMSGHPYFRRALGRAGPSSTVGLTALFQQWQIPSPWDYGHLDYMPGDDIDARIPPPLQVPVKTDPAPGQQDGWKASWSAGVIGTPFGAPD